MHTVHTLNDTVLVLGLGLGKVSAVLVSTSVLVREGLGHLLLGIGGGMVRGRVVWGGGRGVRGRGRVVRGGGRSVGKLGSGGEPDKGETKEGLNIKICIYTFIYHTELKRLREFFEDNIVRLLKKDS